MQSIRVIQALPYISPANDEKCSGKFSTRTDDKERDCKIPDLKKKHMEPECVYISSNMLHSLNFLKGKFAGMLLDVDHCDLVDGDQVVGSLEVPHPLLRGSECARSLWALTI